MLKAKQILRMLSSRRRLVLRGLRWEAQRNHEPAARTMLPKPLTLFSLNYPLVAFGGNDLWSLGCPYLAFWNVDFSHDVSWCSGAKPRALK